MFQFLSFVLKNVCTTQTKAKKQEKKKKNNGKNHLKSNPIQYTSVISYTVY